MSTTDLNVIAENLAQLLTAVTSQADQFYTIFLDPTPQDVTFKAYNSNNELVDTTIANLAKSRIISIVGDVSPEGVVTANIGTTYINTRYNEVYFKVEGNQTNTGWKLVLTRDGVISMLEDYVPKTRKVNNKALATDISLTASDVGALGTDTNYGNSLSISGSNLSLVGKAGSVLSTVALGTTGANTSLSNLDSEGNSKILPSQTGKNGKYLKTNGTAASWEEASSYRPTIFDIKWADHLINDIQWLRGDTFSWQSGAVYVTAYNELVNEYNNASSTSEQDVISIGTPNYTVVGSPTITNGIVSNFSTSNYIEYQQNFDTQGSAWEVNTSFKTSTNISTYQQIISNQTSNGHGGFLLFVENGKIYLALGSDGSTWFLNDTAVTPDNSISAGTKYYIKLEFTGTAYNFYYSTSKITAETSASYTYSSTNTIYGSQKIRIGESAQSLSHPFLGSIDLKESYIKINNATWWEGYSNPVYINYKRTPKGYKIVDSTQETAILNKYNTDGIAWYYILDTTNTRFKLPRCKYKYWKNFSNNTLPVKGNGMTTGWTNGTQNFGTSGFYGVYGSTNTGAYGSAVGNTSYISNNVNDATVGLTTDGTKSGIVVDTTNAIEETGFYLYFYVGEYTQSAIEQTAGITSEQLNAKVDIASLREINPMIVSYVDPDIPTRGYNIWANGYCEQWGAPWWDNASSLTITFLKTMKDANYNITLGNQRSVGAGDGDLPTVTSISTTGFVMQVDNGSYSHWKVSGYLAEGQF